MALSGTLDTFALPDVLRLLASTAKTGRLRITGDRGSGSVWVADGDVVATELASAVSYERTNEEVVFGLLRFTAGSFTFEADAQSPNAGEPTAIVQEDVVNTYRRFDDFDPQPGDAYWATTGDYWAAVRDAWDERIRTTGGLWLEQEANRGSVTGKDLMDWAVDLQEGRLTNEAAIARARALIAAATVAPAG